MPTFDYICEICGTQGRAYRPDTAPRFCSRTCMTKGVVIRGKPTKHIITPERVGFEPTVSVNKDI